MVLGLFWDPVTEAINLLKLLFDSESLNSFRNHFVKTGVGLLLKLERILQSDKSVLNETVCFLYLEYRTQDSRGHWTSDRSHFLLEILFR